MQNQFNAKDRSQWEMIFSSPHPSWKEVPEEASMIDALDLFRSANVRTVLDVGCGVGNWSIYLARNGFAVFGADFSENAIRFCREWAKEEKLSIFFETAAITMDPFPEQMFDAVVASMIFDNVIQEEMETAISLLRQKLKPGGLLFAMFNPFLTPEEEEELVAATNNPTKDISSVTYTDEEIQKAFPGFEVLKFKKYPFEGLVFRGIAVRKL